MRRPAPSRARSLTAAAATALVAPLLVALGPSGSAAEPGTEPGTAPGTAPAGPAAAGPAPLDVLARAAAALRGQPADARADGHTEDEDQHEEHEEQALVEPTLALVDLHEALPGLRGAERAAAMTMLARPTDLAPSPGVDGRPDDGPADPYGNGYAGPSERLCGPRVCVHYRPPADGGLLGGGGDADRVDDLAWVRRSRDVLEQVWDRVVGDLRYRRPLSDGGRGGDGRLDVYLADVGDQGFYGYCAPEGDPSALRAAGFCVLDEDFSRAEFGRDPAASLRVTAAHEFFHVVQYAYDVSEDRWLMETTATWIEERVADDVDDNRQYLDSSQLVRPDLPLDTFEAQGLAQYGNWIFFEHLGRRFGTGVVRDVWDRAAATPRRDRYSLPALRGAVGARGVALPQEYARFAAGNLVPGRSYPEGEAYPAAAAERTVLLEPGRRRSGTLGLRLDHLSHRHLAFTRRDLPRTARLRVAVDGPPPTRGAAARVLVLRPGRVRSVPVRLDREGRGSVVVPFGAGVRQVSVTLANASTRYRCGTGAPLRTCRGTARDDGLRFTASARVVR